MTYHKYATEGQIQQAILDWLMMNQIPAWRTNSGQILKYNTDGSSRSIKLAPKGTADIIGMLPESGRLLAIEVKRHNGTVTPEQQEFIDRINQGGGLAFVARSLEDVLKQLGR